MFAMKQFRFLLVVLLAFFAMAGGARAAPTLSGTSNASALLGGAATPSVTFDFGAGYDFYTLDLSVTYDSSAVSFDPAASFLGLHPGLSLSGDSFTGGPMTTYTALYGDLAEISSLAGIQSFAGAFTVLPGLVEGASSTVTLGFVFGDTNYDVAVVDGTFTVTRLADTVSPIPEPETWALLLGGLGLVAMVTRRRHRLAKSV